MQNRVILSVIIANDTEKNNREKIKHRNWNMRPKTVSLAAASLSFFRLFYKHKIHA